jgi:hypothetical protein
MEKYTITVTTEKVLLDFDSPIGLSKDDSNVTVLDIIKILKSK